MKRFIRLICLMVVFATLAAVPAYAQDQSTRASDYISSYRASCTKLSSTTVGVSFLIIGTGTMDEIGATMVKVQYSSDKVNWTTAKTFTTANTSDMTCTNTASHSAALTCTVPSGKYYRAYVEFYSEKNGGSAARYYYTDII